MGVLFLAPTPTPVVPGTDAYRREIAVLRREFGGRLVEINPNRFFPRHLPVQIPRPFFGFAELPALIRSRGRCAVAQIYSPTLYPYPILPLLRVPVVYNLTGGTAPTRVDGDWFGRRGIVTVADSHLADELRSVGVPRVRVVKPGIDTARFTHHPLDAGGDFHVLMASAPWVRSQFEAKGIDELLTAVADIPWMRLTLLWRGVLFKDVRRRIREHQLEGRVRLLNEMVDVNDILAGVHAAINLATSPDVVTAFPHSLMESLAAGKPVVVSRAIPMAGYVSENGVGEVVGELTAEAIKIAVVTLRDRYSQAAAAAAELGPRDFALGGMVKSFAGVYAELAGSGASG